MLAAGNASAASRVLDLVSEGRGEFSGVDLRDGDLAGDDLSNTTWEDADLSHADLTAADLSGAMLVDADLTSARLRGACLAMAALEGARLAEVDGAGVIGLADAFCSPSTTLPRGWHCQNGQPVLIGELDGDGDDE